MCDNQIITLESKVELLQAEVARYKALYEEALVDLQLGEIPETPIAKKAAEVLEIMNSYGIKFKAREY